MASGREKIPLVLAHKEDSSFARNDDVLNNNNVDNNNIIGKELQEEVSTKFAPKKQESLKLADVYQNLEMYLRSFRVANCGSYLEYHVTEQEKKLYTANFCKDRLCPMCNWRRSLKIFGQVSQIMDVLEHQEYKFLFLTLTVRNCSADELPNTVQILFDGWRKMYNKKGIFQRAISGSFRSLEVTRNKKTGMFHPHLHVILAVNSDYLSGRNYMTQSQWRDLWRDCCNLNYNPIIDIRKIKPNDGKGIKGAVAEVSKYAVKSADFLQGSIDDMSNYVRAFLSALSSRRLCSFTGCFNSVCKDLSLDDVEDGDLVHIDRDSLRDDVNYLIVKCHWCAGVYVMDFEH